MNHRGWLQDHISQERMLELASHGVAAAEDNNDLDEKYRFSPDESEHLGECPQCIEVFGNFLREIIQKRLRADR